MASDTTVAKVMAMLCIAYPRFKAQKETATVYAELLRDLDDGLLIAAAKQHAATSKWFPSVAELREIALQLQAQAQGRRSAEEAWIHVQKAVRRFGWYGESIEPGDGGGWRVPSMLSELERRAVEGLGGWRMLCQSENAPADRAHFLRIYGSLLQRELDGARLLPDVRKAISILAMGEPLSELVERTAQ